MRKREGSRAGSRAGFVPLTNGSRSVSRRLKNMQIRNRNRIRFRIPNAAEGEEKPDTFYRYLVFLPLA
jgi:hypothetical protein